MRKDKGFTILELMIALAIFGILMMAVSQLLIGQIRLFNRTTQQNELENKARVAVMHILDEVRLNKFTRYSPGIDSRDSGIYTAVPEQPVLCLINTAPQESVLDGDLSALPAGTKIYYDNRRHQLWYLDPNPSLIADNIQLLEIEPLIETVRLVRIHLVTANDAGDQTYDLLTWVRLY